jgi:hypothetical protein
MKTKMKTKMKTPTEQQQYKKFEQVIDTLQSTEHDDLFRLFQAGVNYIVDINEKNIFKTYTELGYNVNLSDIYKLITSEETDELYYVDNINFTDVLFNDSNRSNRIMTIYFEAESDYGTHKDLAITIDSFGKVEVDLSDTPWEGSGVCDEIIEILMKYTTKQKYN